MDRLYYPITITHLRTVSVTSILIATERFYQNKPQFPLFETYFYHRDSEKIVGSIC